MGNLQYYFTDPAKVVLGQITSFLLNALLVLIILVIGWLIARVVKAAVKRIGDTFRINELSKKIGLDSLLSKGGLTYSLSELIAVIFYWLGLLITFVIAVNAIGLTVAAALLNRIVLYVPNVIAAVFILIMGMFLATLLRNIVKTAATNAGMSHVNLLAKAVEVTVMVFAVMIMLEQLSIKTQIIELCITIMLGSLGLAFALAFGFGCQDIARKTVSDIIEKLKNK